jgi:hypothetical protein
MGRLRTGYLSRYGDSLRSDEGEILRNRPDWPRSPPRLLFDVYRVSFPGVKRSDCGAAHPSPYSAEVKERVDLHFYPPPVLQWHIIGSTLPLYLPRARHNKNLDPKRTKSSAVCEDQSFVETWGLQEPNHFENSSNDDVTYVVVEVYLRVLLSVKHCLKISV